MATEQAEISSRRRISGIWFIPLLALALGAYLVIHGLLTEGPVIEIAFKTAEGLEQGKTAVKFLISGTGDVTASKVVESTVHSEQLERCVAGRVQLWKFPKPPGGGTVSVTYPFVFRSTGT